MSTQQVISKKRVADHGTHFSHLPSPVSFREDINGLRAWAVMAVLFFHFSLIGLPGGFAGVDVFFVISGYLMTAIIVGGYEKGNFSVWKFYMARARRILPALMVVIVVLLALGWFWLPTPDYQALGSQSAYGLSFLSNIYYWRSAGYFDTAAHEKWLLHTWSLAVEAQFYVLYPLFVAIMWRFWKGLKALTIALMVLFALSLALNLIYTFKNPITAFYLLPMRGWELALGGLVYLTARLGWVSDALKAKGFWLGWLLVLGSFAFINDSLAWPGYWAILPVLGAGLIILAQKENCWLTDNRVMQWLGDRSYSLYLWHWPLVVELYFAELLSDWTWVLGFFALSLLLAHLSYRFVEVPTRSYLSAASLRKELFAIGTVGVVIGLSAVAVKLVTFEGRLPEAAEVAANEANNVPKGGCFVDEYGVGNTGCSFGGPKKVLLAGDSHSRAIRSALIDANRGVVYWGLSGCPTIKGAYFSESSKRSPEICKNFNDDLISVLDHSYKGIPLILVSRTSLAAQGYLPHESSVIMPFVSFPGIPNKGEQFNQYFSKMLISTACHLQKNRQVYLVRPIPEMNTNVPKAVARNPIYYLGIKDIKITLAEYHKRHKLVWEAQDEAAKQCGVKILDPLPYLCDDKYCYGSKNGRPLYYDDDHLSEYGNKFLVPMFEQVFKDTL
jgi:peptidoglycan/LPS O-acetylase OafA/YrhL